jgi:hypothetical protein
MEMEMEMEIFHDNISYSLGQPDETKSYCNRTGADQIIYAI